MPEQMRDQVTPELLEQAKDCKTEDEILALIRNSGMELSEEVLDNMAGGGWGGGWGGGRCNWFHWD